MKNNKTGAAGILIIVLAFYMFVQHSGLGGVFNIFPLAEAGMDYGMLFFIGLLTSVHCLSMCGGINLSQCLPQSGRNDGNKLAVLRSSFLYNFGRIVAYTLVGGLVGALGSVISFTGAFQGVVQLLAGVFMVIMGINMIGLFPSLRKYVPHLPPGLVHKIDSMQGQSNSPLYIGLLNGLMPCGPLQAMQLYALSTGSVFSGALSMFVFSLGTVPLMFGFGALSSVLSKKFTHRIQTVGAALVIVLGLSMFLNGWSLSALPLLPVASAPAASSGNFQETPEIIMENGTQIINSTLTGRGYPAITVQAGTPVKWTIDAPEGSLSGCNYRMVIPEYNLQYQFDYGENVIEFTPEKTGTIPYSCWMGMIRSSITVTE
ncbi:MAG: sulfite exporter TauE/SafE family protein [Clostridia bacterium]|nr:sulfite exporter TauE/SafE family protein [Clostridia bacterium]